MRFVESTSSGRTWLVPEPLSDGGPARPIGHIPHHPPLPENPSFHFSQKLRNLLSGKQMLLDEIPITLKSLHEHYLNGYLAYEPGVLLRNDNKMCQRCGNREPRLFASFFCARCGENCLYCRKCIMMGRVSMCTPLIRWCGREHRYPKRRSCLSWTGHLSSSQQKASDEVAAIVGLQKELLVWAVCGAGKTEVLFQGIDKALSLGLRVCLASPRTDVILELAPRFRKVFPQTELVALYGGSEDHGKQAQFVLSTTHQLLRFKLAFDVIIIDEVDAFPYESDEMLHYAVNQAKRKEASVVYLTATPNGSLKKKVRKGELSAVRIPKRYHNHPLPVPSFVWCGNWKKQLTKNRLPETLKGWVKDQCLDGRQAFLFVPTVKVMEEVKELLLPIDDRIAAVHAEDPERREKVEQFRNGEIPLLVTTSILERGVTVARANAAVFGADDQVFTEQALVQMSGRVGRSADAPGGDVLFFHGGKTKAMVEARRHILAMNKEGFNEGR